MGVPIWLNCMIICEFHPQGWNLHQISWKTIDDFLQGLYNNLLFWCKQIFLLFYCRCHALYLQSVTVNTAFFFTLSPALNMIFACQLRLVCCVYCSWTSANRDMLEEQDSCLEFKLHRLQFIEMVANSPQDSAEVLRFAKHFARFSKRHTRGKHHMKFALYMIFIFLMKAFLV